MALMAMLISIANGNVVDSNFSAILLIILIYN